MTANTEQVKGCQGRVNELKTVSTALALVGDPDHLKVIDDLDGTYATTTCCSGNVMQPDNHIMRTPHMTCDTNWTFVVEFSEKNRLEVA